MDEEEADIKKRIIKANNTIQKLSHRELIEYIAYMEQGYDNLQQENENLRTTIKNDDVAVNNLCKEIENLKQQLKDKDEKISKAIEYIKENIKAELLNGSIWIDKYKLLNILESNKED